MIRARVVLISLLGASATTTVAAADEKKTCTDAYIAAQTLRDDHHLLAARDQMRICARKECSANMQGQMITDCTGWLTDVEGRIPSLVFVAIDRHGKDLIAVKVTIDGQPLADKLDGSALQVDPGEHRFAFDDADGLAHVEKTIVLRETEKNRRVRVALGAAQPTSAPEARPGTGGRTPPVLAIVAGGVGVAGLVVGAATALAATSKHSVLQGECTGSVCPPSAAGDLGTFHTLRVVSAIGYVVGAVGIVGGAALWYFAPSRPSDTSARLWVGPGSAGVMGAF